MRREIGFPVMLVTRALLAFPAIGRAAARTHPEMLYAALDGDTTRVRELLVQALAPWIKRGLWILLALSLLAPPAFWLFVHYLDGVVVTTRTTYGDRIWVVGVTNGDMMDPGRNCWVYPGILPLGLSLAKVTVPYSRDPGDVVEIASTGEVNLYGIPPYRDDDDMELVWKRKPRNAWGHVYLGFLGTDMHKPEEYAFLVPAMKQATQQDERAFLWFAEFLVRSQDPETLATIRRYVEGTFTAEEQARGHRSLAARRHLARRLAKKYATYLGYEHPKPGSAGEQVSPFGFIPLPSGGRERTPDQQRR